VLVIVAIDGAWATAGVGMALAVEDGEIGVQN
jgi:hypothetical protein